MRVSNVKTYALRAPLDEPFGYSQAWYHDRTGVLVQILTDEGIIGWGETYGPVKSVCAIIQEVLKPMIAGEDIPVFTKSSNISRTSPSQCRKLCYDCTAPKIF